MLCVDMVHSMGSLGAYFEKVAESVGGRVLQITERS